MDKRKFRGEGMKKEGLKQLLTVFVMDISQILKYSEVENLTLADIRSWIDQWIEQNINLNMFEKDDEKNENH